MVTDAGHRSRQRRCTPKVAGLVIAMMRRRQGPGINAEPSPLTVTLAGHI